MVGVDRILKEYDIIDALDSVTWYNGLAEEVIKWKDSSLFAATTPNGVPYPNNWLAPTIEFFESWPEDCKDQLQVIWMICVVLFGDYGTSPRSGWIEKKDEFYAFIDGITQTYQEDSP